MSDTTAIEWADATWNPVSGCTKVSPGCAYCYAARVGKRMGWVGPDRTGTFGPHQGGPGRWPEVRLHHDRLDMPLRWCTPRRVFVNSMSDLFHAEVPFDFILDVWRIMLSQSRHIFLVLTKRPDRMRTVVSGLPGAGNIWLGVSVENQRMAERRITLLLDTPATVRFVSCEPLLGPLDLTPILTGKSLLDWVIVGGESGGPPERRLVTACCRKGTPFGPGVNGVECRNPESGCTGAYDWRPKPAAMAWVRSLRDQCQVAGIPFFFKQWGGPAARSGGRLLDGRTWDEQPLTGGAA